MSKSGFGGNKIHTSKKSGTRKVFFSVAHLIFLASLAILQIVVFELTINSKQYETDSDFMPIKISTGEMENRHQGNHSQEESLPKWILDYFAWHEEQRIKFPGKLLFEDPDAPGLLIRTCLGLCGGLTDRLGQLPFDLYLANQTNRVLLIHWLKPRALDNFLIPPQKSKTSPSIDWRLPYDVKGWGFNDLRRIKHKVPHLFEGFDERQAEEGFWEEHFDASMERATTGDYRNEKILQQSLLGHLSENQLEERLTKLGETDMIHNTKSFGNIFNAFFQMSPKLKIEFEKERKRIFGSNQEYFVVHCRVRHSASFKGGNAPQGKGHGTTDRSGFAQFEGEIKDKTVRTATHAMKCMKLLTEGEENLSRKDLPIYFMSDSVEIVKYMVEDLNDPEFLNNSTMFSLDRQLDRDAFNSVQNLDVRARSDLVYNPHLDKNKGMPPEKYFSVFIDFFLAIGGKCMVYGVGHYAYFASKVSGTKCKVQSEHDQGPWLESSNLKRMASKQCLPGVY